MTDETPISYEAAVLGTPMLSSSGAEIGTLEHVLEVPDLDLFDGIVITTKGGLRFIDADQVGEITRSQITRSQITRSQITRSQITRSQITRSQITRSQITRSQIRCHLDDAQASDLPAPDGPPVYRVDALEDTGQSLHDRLGDCSAARAGSASRISPGLARAPARPTGPRAPGPRLPRNRPVRPAPRAHRGRGPGPGRGPARPLHPARRRCGGLAQTPAGTNVPPAPAGRGHLTSGSAGPAGAVRVRGVALPLDLEER